MSNQEIKDNLPVLTDEQRSVPQLKWVDTWSRVLDTQFRVPFTDIRFGLDFILGLVPGAGDLLSLCFSGILITTMVRHGASGRLAAKMLLNVAADAVFGSVPILGNIFDLFFRANHRNLELMKDYYGEGGQQGSAWPIVWGILITILLLCYIVVYLSYTFITWLFSAI